MKKSIFVLIVLVACGSSYLYAAKKPLYSFGVFGGFSGSTLMSVKSPTQDYNQTLFNEFYDQDKQYYPGNAYLPEIWLNRDMPQEWKDLNQYPFELEGFNYQTAFLKDVVYNLVAGLTFDVPIKKSDWAFKTYASYQTIGINIENEIQEVEKVDENELKYVQLFRRDVKNKYLIVPALIKRSWPNRTTFYAQAGPYAGFLMESKVKGRTLKSYLSDSKEPVEYNITADTVGFHTNKIDYGVVVGGGMEIYWTSNSSITLEMNVGYGLRKIDSKYNNEYTEYDADTWEERVGRYAAPFSMKNYYGLNSKARNFHVMFTVGFRYSVYK